MNTILNKSKIFITLGLVLASLSTVIMLPTPARAACASNQQEVSIGFPGASRSADGKSWCVSKNNTTDITQNPIFVFLRGMVQFLAAGVGIAVVAGIVFGGYLYITAGGNASQTQKAKMIMLNAIIGLLLFVFAFAIINFLIPGGLLR